MSFLLPNHTSSVLPIHIFYTASSILNAINKSLLNNLTYNSSCSKRLSSCYIFDTTDSVYPTRYIPNVTFLLRYIPNEYHPVTLHSASSLVTIHTLYPLSHVFLSYSIYSIIQLITLPPPHSKQCHPIKSSCYSSTPCTYIINYRSSLPFLYPNDSQFCNLFTLLSTPTLYRINKLLTLVQSTASMFAIPLKILSSKLILTANQQHPAVSE